MKVRALSVILALCACHALVQGQEIDYVFASKKKNYGEAKDNRIQLFGWTNLIEGYGTYYLFVVLENKRKASSTLAWL